MQQVVVKKQEIQAEHDYTVIYPRPSHFRWLFMERNCSNELIYVVRGLVHCTHKFSNLIVLTAYSSFPAPQTLSTLPINVNNARLQTPKYRLLNIDS